MMEKLEQLKELFPDRSPQDLSVILARHNFDVNRTAEAVLAGETGEAVAATGPRGRGGKTARWKWSTICGPPPPRHRNISLEAERMAFVKEETDMQAAIEASLSPPRSSGFSYNQLRTQEDEDLRVAARQKRSTGGKEWRKGALNKQKQPKPLPKPPQTNKFAIAVRNGLKSLGAALLEAPPPTHNKQPPKLPAKKKEKRNSIEELEGIRRETQEACTRIITVHLKGFLEKNPGGTYEEWIADLHPENTRDAVLSAGVAKNTIDFRFYVEDSGHRLLWNRTLAAFGADERRFVAPRRLSASDDIIDPPTDKDDEKRCNEIRNESTVVSLDNDLISFANDSGRLQRAVTA